MTLPSYLTALHFVKADAHEFIMMDYTYLKRKNQSFKCEIDSLCIFFTSNISK